MICTAILQESWARAAVKELSRRWDFWLTINTFLPRLSRDPALQPVLLNFILPRVGGNRPGERAAVALIEHMIDMLPDPPASVRPVARGARHTARVGSRWPESGSRQGRPDADTGTQEPGAPRPQTTARPSLARPQI